MKAKLSTLSKEEHQRLSQNLSHNLNKLLQDQGVIQKNLTIGVFSPIQQEPHWFLALDENLESLMAYPSFEQSSGDERMVFKLSGRCELENSSDFGVEILGPRQNSPIVDPQIVIVPGLAFSSGGKRLGRGKGFYDKFLENKNYLKIGIGFEMQIESEIPVDAHDVLMNYVVTDLSIYKTN